MDRHPFRVAVEARDHAAMVACLAPDVVFHSPVTFRPFEGREVVGHVLGAVLRVFADFAYTDEVGDGGVHALVFRARVGDREIEGLDLIRPGADGLIADLTVMVRPLSGLRALAEAMARELGAAPA